MNDFRVRIAEWKRIHLGDEHKMVRLRQQSGGSNPGGMFPDQAA